MILEVVCVGEFQVNCYIVACDKNSEALIIDPGDGEDKIRGRLKKYGLKPSAVINTHGHIDHIACDDKFGVPVYIHADDAPLLKDPRLNLSDFIARPFSVQSEPHLLKDKEVIQLAGIELEVIHLPGHTPGGIALLMKNPEGKILFSGDSLFYRSIGRTDFPGADHEALVKSIKKRLLVLDSDTLVYPGHGAPSTIGDEKERNHFLIQNERADR